MCGIVGIFGGVDKAKGTKMLEAVKHRGPDSFEVITTAKHTLGACRLAITGDPQAPAIYQEASSGIRVLFNGEIYNYGPLRSELERCGKVFYTDLETEVIAKTYQAYGMMFAEKLKGMFAIAIQEGQELLLVRDRFGIKPLYYMRINGAVCFSSEIKGLLAACDSPLPLDEDTLEEARLFGYIHSAESTPFRPIRQVRPGTVISWDHGNESRYTYYEKPVPTEKLTDNGDYRTLRILLRERFIRAIENQFRHGQQEKGLYLSGGLDSSSVALVARLILGYPLKTFTLADEHSSPDLIAARKVAEALGTEHHEYLATETDYRAALQSYALHYESPIDEGVFGLQGGIAFHLLSRYVSEHVKIAFSGEGADELFGGYYWPHTHPLGFADRIRDRLRELALKTQLTNVVDEYFPHPEDETLYRKNIFRFLLEGGLTNYHLQSVDRSAGAYGFEVRPCYLDDDLAQLAMTLPIEYRATRCATKVILRDLFREEFARTGLDWVLNRQKIGMPAAVEKFDPLLRDLAARWGKKFQLEQHIASATGTALPGKYLLQQFKDTFSVHNNV